MRSFSHRWLGGSGLFLSGLVLLFGVFSCRRPAVVEPVVESAVAAEDGAILVTIREPEIVYQKALWRRPGPGDTIRSAERREWRHSADGVRRWQWFIEFTPSAVTRAWLATNPFALTPVTQIAWLAESEPPPGWFPREAGGWGVMKKTGSAFTLIQSKDGKHVFAMDEGFGFSAAADEPES